MAEGKLNKGSRLSRKSRILFAKLKRNTKQFVTQKEEKFEDDSEGNLIRNEFKLSKKRSAWIALNSILNSPKAASNILHDYKEDEKNWTKHKVQKEEPKKDSKVAKSSKAPKAPKPTSKDVKSQKTSDRYEVNGDLNLDNLGQGHKVKPKKENNQFQGKINLDTDSKEEINDIHNKLIDYLDKVGETNASEIVKGLVENQKDDKGNSVDVDGLIKVNNSILDELKKLNKHEYHPNVRKIQHNKPVGETSKITNEEDRNETLPSADEDEEDSLDIDFDRDKDKKKKKNKKSRSKKNRSKKNRSVRSKNSKRAKRIRSVQNAGKRLSNVRSVSKGSKLARLGKAGKALTGLGGRALASGASLAGKAALGAAKFLGPLGLAVTAGMAIYDGFQGWNKAGENLGIDEKDLTFGNKAASSAGSIVSGLTFGLVDAKDASKGINNFFGGNKTIEKYEKMGAIDHNSIGDSEIKDWNKIRSLKPEEIQEIIDIDDWSDEDLEHLKQCKSDVEKGIKIKEETKTSLIPKSVTNFATAVFEKTPIGLAVTGVQKLFKKDDEEYNKLTEAGIIEPRGMFGGKVAIKDWDKVNNLSINDLNKFINLDNFEKEDLDRLKALLENKKADLKKEKEASINATKDSIKELGNALYSDKTPDGKDPVFNSFMNLDNLSENDLNKLRNQMFEALGVEKKKLYEQLDSEGNSLKPDDQKKLDLVAKYADKIQALEEAERKSYLKHDVSNNLYDNKFVSNMSDVDSGKAKLSVEDAEGDPNSVFYTGNTEDTSNVGVAEGPKIDLSSIPAVSIQDANGDLGSYVKKFESGSKGPEAIGYDTNGGTSYGSYQLASRVGTFASFLNWCNQNGGDFGQRLAAEMRKVMPWNTGSNRGPAVDVWKQFAQLNSGKDIGALEHAYIKSTHYDLALSKIGAKDVVEKDRGLQEALWSTSVQHGPAGAAKIFNATYQDGISGQDWLNAIYSERGKRGRFKSSSAEVYSGVLSRFKQELGIVKGLSNTKASDTNVATGDNSQLSIPNANANVATGNDSQLSIPNDTGVTQGQRQPLPYNGPFKSVEGDASLSEGTDSGAPDSQATPTSASQAIVALKNLGVNADQVQTGGGGWSSVSKLNPKLLTKLTQAEQEFKQKTGHVVHISSAFRTPEDVKKLSSRSNAAKGFSPHQTGFAVDLVADNGEKTMGAGYGSGVVAEFSSIASKYGLIRPLAPRKNEEQHFEVQGARNSSEFNAIKEQTQENAAPRTNQFETGINAEVQEAISATPKKLDSGDVGATFEEHKEAKEEQKPTNVIINQSQNSKADNSSIEDYFMTDSFGVTSDADIVLGRNI